MYLEGATARKPRNYMVAPIAIHVIQHIMELPRERYGLRTLVGFKAVRLFRWCRGTEERIRTSTYQVV
jgi:hypothetical protein